MGKLYVWRLQLRQFCRSRYSTEIVVEESGAPQEAEAGGHEVLPHRQRVQALALARDQLQVVQHGPALAGTTGVRGPPVGPRGRAPLVRRQHDLGQVGLVHSNTKLQDCRIIVFSWEPGSKHYLEHQPENVLVLDVGGWKRGGGFAIEKAKQNGVSFGELMLN